MHVVRGWGRPVAGCFLAALLLRIAAIAAIDPILGMNAEHVFLGGARRLLSGYGFGDPSYPILAAPLYAVFIAFGAQLFGDAQLPIKLAQAVADSLTVVLLYFICRRIFEERVARVAAAMAALYPFSIYAAASIGDETFFTFFLAGFVLLGLRAIETGRWGLHCAAGAVLALATLIRAASQFYPAFWLLTLCLLCGPNRRTLARFAAFAACFALLIAPWTVRNYLVLGEFIPVAVNGGLPALGGADERFFTIPGRNERLHEYYEQIAARGIETPAREASPIEWDRFFRRAALERYKIRFETDPWSFPGFMLKKFARLWYGTESGENELPILLINAAVYPFCLAGIWLCIRRREKKALVLLMPVLYLVALHWTTFVMFRYMVPVMPYLLGFASLAAVAAIDRFAASSALAGRLGLAPGGQERGSVSSP
jgi:4-amino-4-deoxy-L-arabinose transferase-like glycosyltransferase